METQADGDVCVDVETLAVVGHRCPNGRWTVWARCRPEVRGKGTTYADADMALRVELVRLGVARWAPTAA